MPDRIREKNIENIIMPKTNHAFDAISNHSIWDESWRYKFVFISLLLFAISLPFNNAVEWNITSFARFEVKLTMLAFALLFVSWLLCIHKYPKKRSLTDVMFLMFAFLYGASQFASLMNSPFPSESLKQGIIITSLLTMMVVTHKIILDKRMAEYVLTTIGILSLLIGIVATINYYAFVDSFGRLGQSGKVLGVIGLGGDAFYFGDILLYSIGSVFFVLLKLYKRKHGIWLALFLLLFWFSAIVLTMTKGLIASTICFLFCLLLFLRGRRLLIVLSIMLFVVTMILNIGLIGYLNQKTKSKQESVHAILPKDIFKEPLVDRLNILSQLGNNSLSIRAKAIVVSVKNSTTNLWFGHGAGLSQRLLPQMGNSYDIAVDDKERGKMEELKVYGEGANRSLIDSHILFLTEFFNVGVLGLVTLVGIVSVVIINQIKTLKSLRNKNDNINELLFATLISMLVYRMTGSLIVIPFLWFMLGLSFGVCKLYWESSSATNLS